MLINRSGFSQAAESIRYLFVNSTGISIGIREVFKNFKFSKNKEGFYTPRNHVEKIVFLRCIKTFGLIQLMDANGIKAELLEEYETKMRTSNKAKKKIETNDWKIAFPHEKEFIISEQNVYNSLYICKLLSLDRHEDLVAEALVLKKSLESRKKYLTRSKDLPQCVENISDNLLKEMNDLDLISEYKEFSPNLAVVAISIMNSVFRLSEKETFSECIEDSYNFESEIFRLSLSDVMNSKGSTEFNSVAVEKLEEKVVDKKLIRKTQSSKCYKTTMQNITSYSNNSNLTDEINLNLISKTTTSLMPVLIHNTVKEFKHVARMVKKGDLGPREIAILNSPCRISSYFVESLARIQRGVEHKRGDKTNLIEIKEKDDIINDMFDNFKSCDKYYFDNADCSSWGPSQLSYVLYFVLAARIKSKYIRCLLRRQLELFSNKIIKFPSKIGLNKLFTDKTSGSIVHKVIKEISNLPRDIGNSDMGYLEASEGMFQGVLGNLSSLLAADNLRLIESVMLRKKMDGENVIVKIESHDTSDDISRAIEFIKGIEPHRIFTYDNFITNKINGMNGIKRNNYKSVYSKFVCEFNSIFRTFNGIFNPDIKSRLSFIDYSHSSDMITSAERCLTQGAEYLRKEGSIVGSIWVQLLNTHLHLLQYQGIALYRKIKTEIFSKPFELMGIPEINPLLYTQVHPLIFKMRNYRVAKMTDIEYFRYMLFSEKRPQESVIVGEKIENEVITMSRSCLIDVRRKPSKSNRMLTEFLNSIDDGLFLPALLKVKSPITYLISNEQRESDDEQYLGSAMRFIYGQTPMDSKIFKVRSEVYLKFCEDMISKKQIFEYSIKYEQLMEVEQNCVNGVEIEDFEELYSLLDFVNTNETVINYLNNVKISGVSPIKRFIRKRRETIEYIDQRMMTSLKEKILDNLKPGILGGTSTIRDYVRNEMIIDSKIKKLGIKTQKFNVVHLDGDDDANLVSSLLRSNLLEGSRAFIMNSNLSLESKGSYLTYKSILGKTPKYTISNKIVRILSMKESVNKLDITDLINFICNKSFSLSKNEKLSLNLLLYNFVKRIPSEIKLYIDSERYVPTRIENYYNPSSDKFRTDVRPTLNSKNETVRLDIIERYMENYTHNVSVYDGEEYYPKDGKNDKHLVKTMRSNYYRVELHDQRGLLVLKCVSDNSDEIDMTLAIMGKVETPLPAFVELRRKRNHMLFNKLDKIKVKRMLKGYTEFEGFKLAGPIRNQLMEERICEREDLKEAVFDLSGEDSSKFYHEDCVDDDMFDDFEESIMGKVKEDAEDDHESTEDESEELESETVSEDDGSLSVQSSLLQSNASSHYKLRSNSDKTVNTIRLVKGLAEYYETEEKFSSVGKLLIDLEKLEDFEKFWCLSILDHMMSNFASEY